MRGTPEADRETDREERVVSERQQEDNLVWRRVKANNALIDRLKEASNLISVLVRRDINNTKKQIRQMRKMHGR